MKCGSSPLKYEMNAALNDSIGKFFSSLLFSGEAMLEPCNGLSGCRIA